MQLLNEFEVPLSPDQTWTLLTDLQKVAPCLPGAAITSVEGEDFYGRAKIKVGPITAEYKGSAQFSHLDASAHKATLIARGKDARGQGEATATVTASLAALGRGTKVTVETDLALTGKVAQFGRGVLADVSGALMGLFAERLQEMVIAEGMASEAPSSTATAPAEVAVDVVEVPAPGQDTSPRGSAREQDDVLDVLALAGGMSWSKVLPAGGVLVSIVAALISVFAAGYAAAKARSVGR